MQLGRHGRIVDGRRKDDHVRPLVGVNDLAHIVLLDALAFAFAVAVFTAEAAIDLHPAHVQHANLIAGLLRWH